MAGPVTITCPGCGAVFPLPAQVLRVFGHTVVVRLDRSKAHGHMAACPGMAEPGSPAPEQEASRTVAVPEDKLPEADLVGRIHLMLSSGAFMSRGGSRACTMCGVTGDDCLRPMLAAKADAKSLPCCAACGDGNTHPAPGEARGMCAEWAAARAT